MSKLIAICGSQGSGKTTVLNYINQQYNIPVVQRKSSRYLMKKLGKTIDEINGNPSLSKMFQEEILKIKFQDDLEAKNSDHPVFLTERTPIEFAVYTIFTIGNINEYNEFTKHYFHRCLQFTNSMYQHIFFLEPLGFVVDDNVRPSSELFSETVDVAMKHFYQKYVPSDKITTIESASIEHRAQKIIDKISSL